MRIYFQNLKLGQRLALSYGVVIALLIGVAFAGLAAMVELSRTTEDALKDKYPKTILVNQLINNLETIARAMRNTLFLNEPQQIQDQLLEINVTKIKMAASLANLKKSVIDVQGMQIIRDIEIVHSAYIVNQEEFVGLVAENRMGEAKNLLLVDLHPYQIQYFDFLHKLNLHQSTLMSSASSKISQSYFFARTLMLMFTVVAVLLSMLITVFITRSLLNQLGGEPAYAAAVAKKITMGDLSSEIQIKAADKSSLLYVMERMRDSLLERSEALESSNLELEAMVHTLKHTQEELVLNEKMAALGFLVAGVAHELNTPLGNGLMAATTLADLTKEIFESFENESIKRSQLEAYFIQAQEGGEILLRNLSRASELVSSFKQVAVDRETSQLRKFVLLDVIKETVLILQPMLKKTPFEIVCDVPSDIVMESYPGALGQVLSNLISNALIHGFDKKTSGKIRISARQMSTQLVELVVADDGVGIAPEHLTHIYDPFFFHQNGAWRLWTWFTYCAQYRTHGTARKNQSK